MALVDLNQLTLAELFQTLVSGDHLDALLRIAIEEDLGAAGDVTTQAHVAAGVSSSAEVRARGAGVLAGAPILDRLLRLHAPRLSWWWNIEDGESFVTGDVVLRVAGPLDVLLPVERIMLNLLGRLSGVATTTARYVAAIKGHEVLVCDTRKTTPGYRALEKYAVGCGGGHLHRIGLHDAFLLKDNHLAEDSSADQVLKAAQTARSAHELRFIEVEVDTLDQMRSLLDPADRSPAPSDLIDIVLLDNMAPDRLVKAVAWRDRHAPTVQLEASGGITLDSIADVAASGVDRIAVGALTHSAVQVDFGLDLS